MSIVRDKYRGSAEYDQVRDLLISAAKQKTVVLYHPNITRIMGLTEPSGHMAGELGQILGEISEDEHIGGRPLLSAVAIGSENRPGSGFFLLARQLGKPVGNDEDVYWQRELRAVFDEWGTSR